MTKYQLYLHDLGSELKSLARAHAAEKAMLGDIEDKAFNSGMIMAYVEVISLMQQQALSFEIPLAELQLADINPEQELLTP